MPPGNQDPLQAIPTYGATPAFDEDVLKRLRQASGAPGANAPQPQAPPSAGPAATAGPPPIDDETARRLRMTSARNNQIIGGSDAHVAMFPERYAEDPVEKLSIWERASKGVALGYAQMVPASMTVAGGILEFAGAEEAGGKLAEKGLDLQEWLEGHLAVENPTLADHFFTGAGSVISFFGPSATLSTFSKISKLGTTWKMITGSGVMSLLEATVEQSQRQQQLMGEGMTPAEALKASEKVFWQNLGLLMVTNLAPFHPGHRLARAAVSAGSEGIIQERLQAVIQDVAAGTGQWSDYFDPEKHQTETIVGTGLGGAIGGILPGATKEKKPADKTKPTPEDQEGFEGELPPGMEEFKDAPTRPQEAAVVPEDAPRVLGGDEELAARYGPLPRPGEAEPVTFTNEEEGVTAIVSKNEDGGATVTLRDDDSGEIAGAHRKYKKEDLDKAFAFAQQMVEGKIEVGTEDTEATQETEVAEVPVSGPAPFVPSPQQQAILDEPVDPGLFNQPEPATLSKDQRELMEVIGTEGPIDVDAILAKSKEQEARKKAAPVTLETIKSGKKAILPLPAINTDPDRFQMRDEDGGAGINEEFVQEAVDAFDETKVNPITVWKDPKDGKFYVLDGHHTREILSRVGEKSADVKLFKGTESKAIAFSEEANAARRGVGPLDAAKVLRKARNEGATKKDIAAKAKKIGGKNAKTFLAISHLNPKGQVMSALRSMQAAGEAELTNMMDMARWIGLARQSNPELTNAHEQEMFEQIRKDYKNKNGYRTQQEFSALINNRTQTLAGFDYTKPLNLKQAVSRTAVQSTFDQEIADANARVAKALAVKEAKLKEFTTTTKARPGIEGEALSKALRKYEDDITIAQREVLALNERKGGVNKNAQGEQTMFMGGTRETSRARQGKSNTDVLFSASTEANTFSSRLGKFSEVTRTDGASNILRRIGKRFGVDVVFFETESKSTDVAAGFYLQGDRRVFVNVDSKFPAIHIMGHEIGHFIKSRHPGAWNTINEAAIATMKPLGLKAYAANRGIPTQLGDGAARGEFISDIVAEQFTKNEFWDHLKSMDKALWSDLLSLVKAFLKHARAGISKNGYGMAGYFKNYAVLENVVRKQMAAVSKAERAELEVKAGEFQQDLFRTGKTEQGALFMQGKPETGTSIMSRFVTKLKATQKGVRERGAKSGWDLGRVMYQKMFDKNTWLYAATRNALKAAGYDYWAQDPGTLPDKVLQKMSGWGRVVDLSLKQAVMSFDGKSKLSDGLQVIIKRYGLAKWIDNNQFGQFMIAARMQSMHRKLGDALFTGEKGTQQSLLPESEWSEQAKKAKAEYDDYQKLYKEFAAKYPKWATAVKEMSDWSNSLMERVLQSGMISQEQYDKMIKKYDIYAPLFVLEKETTTKGRVAYEMDRLIPGQTRMDPLDSMVKNAYRLEFLLQNNFARIKAAELVERLSGGHSLKNFGRRVVDNTKPLQDYVDEMIAASGLDPADLDADSMKAITTAAEMYATAEYQKEGVIAIMRDGEVEYWQFEKDILDVYTSVAVKPTHDMIKFFTLQTKMLRAGAVLTPEFMARNPVRDFMSVAVISGQMVNNPKDALLLPFRIMSAANQIVNASWRGKPSADYTEFITSGAGGATFVHFDQQELRKKVDDINRGTGREFKMQKFKENPPKYILHSHPLTLLQEISNVTENMTRLAVYKKTRNDLMAEGVPESEAKARATVSARESSTDFSRGGEYAVALNKLIPFFNASLQGNDKMMRTLLRDKGGRTAAWVRGAMMVTLPSVLLWMANHDEDWYKDQPLWMKNHFWLFSLDDGKTIWKIPKPFEIGLLFGSLAERFLDWRLDQDPDAMKAWAKQYKDAVWTLDPASLLGPMVSSAVEAKHNYDAFRDTKVVKGWLEDVVPREQYTANTSEFAKWLGDKGPGNGWSPLKIDHIIRGSFGGLGRWGTDIVSEIIMMSDPKIKDMKPSSRLLYDTIPDWAPVVRGFNVPTPTTYTRAQNDFYKELDRSRLAINTVRAFKSGGASREDFIDIYRRNGVDIALGESLARAAKEIGVVSKRIRAIQGAPADVLDRDEKRKLIDEAVEARGKLFKKYMDGYNKVDKKELQKKIDASLPRIGREFDESNRR